MQFPLIVAVAGGDLRFDDAHSVGQLRELAAANGHEIMDHVCHLCEGAK